MKMIAFLHNQEINFEISPSLLKYINFYLDIVYLFIQMASKRKAAQLPDPNRFNPKYRVANPATPSLQEYLTTNFGKEINMAVVTGLSKINGKFPIEADNKFIKRYTNPNGSVNTTKLLDVLKNKEQYTRGNPLSEDVARNIFLSNS